ncbi:MAG: hypothetical protein C4323_22620 [Mastigocladus sp. ERB_26_2]
MRSPELTSPTSPDFTTVLEQAVSAYRGEASDRPAAPAVVNALLQAEKAAKQQKLTYSFIHILHQLFVPPRNKFQRLMAQVR